jgi:hypothetical protein
MDTKTKEEMIQEFREKKDYDHAIPLMTELAEAGNVEMMKKLARIYGDPDTGKADPRLAFVWAGKAAEAKDAHSMYLLSAFYQTGVGTSADTKKAREWLEKAADAGDQEANLALGKAILLEKLTPEMQKRIIDCFTKAVGVKPKFQDNLYSDACLAMSFCYAFGVGTAQDYGSVEWYLAEAGYYSIEMISERDIRA